MRSVLIYTVHKAASMFVHRVTCEMASRLEIPYHSVNDSPEKRKAIKQMSWRSAVEEAGWHGCFGPIRGGEHEPQYPEKLSDFSVLLHLRDPRDVLTSLYFSHTYSHVRRKGGFNPSDEERARWEAEGPDAFVLKSLPEYKRRYENHLSHLLGRENVIFVKYEDMVSSPDLWLADYIRAFRHLPIPHRKSWFRSVPNSWEEMARYLSCKFAKEFKTPRENKYNHKRQVLPGDHRRKLTPETVSLLNDELGPVMERLGYEI